jgi:hypothetical protein
MGALGNAENSAPTAVIGRPFQKGRSGNPGGRPKKNPEADAILKAVTPKAAQKLADLLNSEDERVAFAAAKPYWTGLRASPRRSAGWNCPARPGSRQRPRSLQSSLLARMGLRAQRTEIVLFLASFLRGMFSGGWL